jgi:hypothetical protein
MPLSAKQHAIASIASWLCRLMASSLIRLIMIGETVFHLGVGSKYKCMNRALVVALVGGEAPLGARCHLPNIPVA